MGAEQSTEQNHHNTTQVSLPHNYEKILAHADSKIDMSSKDKMLEQLYAGVLLNQGKKKYWVKKGTNSNGIFSYARDLSITWGSDCRYWQWTTVTKGNETLTLAELLNVCWLEIHGKFEISDLSPETEYEVVFSLKLKDPCQGLHVPVNVKLTTPDGCKQEHKENLMQQPKGKWVEIKAGEFKTSAGNRCGEIEYSLYEIEGGNWKKGLVLKGVSICPKA